MRVLARLFRLAVAGAFVALSFDRWLAARAARRGAGPGEPIRTFVVIDASPERVWAEVAAIERQPLWMREMKEVRLLTPGPVGVGTRGEALVRILGIAVRDPVAVTEFEPPRRFAIRHEGVFSGGGLIELEPSVDGRSTTVRWAETLVPPVLRHLGAAVQRPILRRIFQDDLVRLRDMLEAEDAVEPGDATTAGPMGPA